MQTFPDITILRHGVTAFFQRFCLVYIGLNVWINDPVLNCTGESGNHLSEHTFQQLRKKLKYWTTFSNSQKLNKTMAMVESRNHLLFSTHFSQLRKNSNIEQLFSNSQILNKSMVMVELKETIYLFAHISASWKIQMLGKTRILENF